MFGFERPHQFLLCEVRFQPLNCLAPKSTEGSVRILTASHPNSASTARSYSYFFHWNKFYGPRLSRLCDGLEQSDQSLKDVHCGMNTEQDSCFSDTEQEPALQIVSWNLEHPSISWGLKNLSNKQTEWMKKNEVLKLEVWLFEMLYICEIAMEWKASFWLNLHTKEVKYLREGVKIYSNTFKLN